MKKILIIEDEKILGEMYQDKFSQAGFKVILTLEAEEGLVLAKKEKPDLIILDILLPRENGLFFLAQLRKDPEISSIPVVAFSNYDDSETKKQALKLRAKAYLIKTQFTPKQLLEEIKKYF